MEQVLFYAGLVEEWGPALGAYGMASSSDLLFVQPPTLVALGMTFGEAAQLIAVAWNVHAAGGIDYYAEMRSVAEEAEAVALALLQSTAATLDEGAVGGFLWHARKHLDESQEPRAAVLALTSVECACGSCHDAELAKSLGAVVRAVTDALIWRVQLRAPFGSRDSFLFQLEMAYAQPLGDTMRSKLLLSHYKAVAERFPSAFLSNAKTDALRKGRGCRKAKPKKESTMPVEVQMGDA